MYKKVQASSSFTDREKEIVKFWNEEKIFERTVEEGSGKPVYSFYDGPPTANGQPHIGHVITRVVKDLFPRYKIMQGYDVPRKAGWDTHGLPVEIEVEKLLGINGKEGIEEFGLDPFIGKCKESVWKYKEMWEEFSKVVGYWVDMDDPYVTYHNNYIESEWWALKEIYNKDLLYKGFKITPYCPRCGTPLSSHEVAQGYKDVRERTAFVRFKLRDEDADILAWTTTPWTLPSNVALCVNPDEEYVLAKTETEKCYIAKELATKILGEEVEILKTLKGRDMEGMHYIPLWDFAKPESDAFYIVCDNYVTLTDGTGVVHIAPAFGEDDNQVGRKYSLPFVQFVNSKGEMTQETDWPGVFCKDADIEILKDLESKGLLFSSPKVEHSYPHCWRCDTPLIYYARESWFIKMTEVKENLIKNNNTINWMPESIGTKRFGDWLQNVQDWGISRNRYWGTPLNIWECGCGHKHCIGSIEELKSMSKNCPDDIELHRPYIDEVTIGCEKCGGVMNRVSEVIDCWFDSGAMPFAQHHYPFENKEQFEAEFPADFISEAVDQTRGWFYSLLAISTLLFDKAPFKNVIVLGHVNDENGQKMSKSKGNAINPMDALGEYGADAVRWYFYTSSAPWLPSRFHGKAVVEAQRKFLSTLYNSYAFYVLYADIDKFNPHEHKLDENALTVMDKWLVASLNKTIKTVTDHLENYRIPEGAKTLSDFTDELSNWYVRRCRERFWASELTADKIAAYKTLHHTLVTLCKIAAPFIPFMTEEIYQNIERNVNPDVAVSIHLNSYPKADDSLIDEELLSNMEVVLSAVNLGRAARNEAVLKNRQPLAEIFISGKKELSEQYCDIIREELNIKKVTFVNDGAQFVSYILKPQLKLLGRKFGKQINAVREALLACDGNEKKKELTENGFIEIVIEGETHKLIEEELLIETTKAEGFTSVADGDMTVAIDTKLTDALIDEGYLREMVSKIQQMRKDSGFEVIDKIKLAIVGNEKLLAVAKSCEDEICSDVLAVSLTQERYAFGADWDINGLNVTIYIEKA